MLNAMWYGVPQSRNRLFFVGLRNPGKSFLWPERGKKVVCVGEALREVGEIQRFAPRPKGWDVVFPFIRQGEGAVDCVPKDVLARYVPRMVKNRTFSFSGMCVRLHPNKPAGTIIKTHIPYAVAVHPWENRHLAIEEILCLSSFPADFKLTGNFKQQWE